MSKADTPFGARSTLANRLTHVVDKARGLSTKFGVRSQRVFLVWTHWTGDVRGEGVEHVLARREIEPRPLVSELSAIMRRPYSIGQFPEGSVRVSEISNSYTSDQLKGLVIPTPAFDSCCGCACGPANPLGGKPVHASGPTWHERVTDGRVDFFWECYEDGRGDLPPTRTRFRVAGEPGRLESRVQWVVNLERASEETSRDGEPQIGNDAQTTNLAEDNY